MDIQEISVQLQKFADANGINIDAESALENMDAGDFVALNGAIDNSDNRSIMQILQKYSARTNENYNFFSGKIISESEDINHIMSMGVNELVEHYRSIKGSYHDVSHLSLQEMRTLVYEDLASQLTANQISSANNSQQQQQINPQTQAKMKQAELQKNTGNMNVTVPGDQSGTNQVAPVVGIDVGPTPEQTLVVTKNTTQPNQVNVFGLDDVSPIDQNNQNVTEDLDPQEINNQLMAPPAEDRLPSNDSPLTHTEPGIGELIKSISSVESEDNVFGDESPLGNSSQDAENEIIDQILDFCSRMRGR